MVRRADLENFLKDRKNDYEMKGVQALLNGEALNEGALHCIEWPDEVVRVRVETR